MHYNLLKENWELEKVKDIDLRSCKNWVETSAGKNRNPKSRFRDKIRKKIFRLQEMLLEWIPYDFKLRNICTEQCHWNDAVSKVDLCKDLVNRYKSVPFRIGRGEKLGEVHGFHIVVLSKVCWG